MNDNTKKCKHCQMEIPKKAKVCPHCRRKQGGILKKIVIAVFILFVILTVIGSEEEENVTITKNDNSSKTSTDEGKEENSTKDDVNFITVGDSFETSDLKVTVDEVSADFQEYDNEYGWNTPEDGMKYVMASFTFENIGTSDEYVSIYDFDCYADNTICDQEYSLDDSDFINANLSSGRKVSFKTYYAVPIDSKTVELEYEINSWTSEKIIIKIQ